MYHDISRSDCLHFEYIGYRLASPDITQILQWRHNESDGVSNHRRHDCLLNRLFRRRSKKTSKPRVTILCEEFLAQKASNAENVFIWWRHHQCSNSYDLFWVPSHRLIYNQLQVKWEIYTMQGVFIVPHTITRRQTWIALFLKFTIFSMTVD